MTDIRPNTLSNQQQKTGATVILDVIAKHFKLILTDTNFNNTTYFNYINTRNLAQFQFIMLVGLCILAVRVLGYRDPEVRVRFPVLPNFLRNSGSGMGFTQPREYNSEATWKKK
jgi:hypothetical protein